MEILAGREPVKHSLDTMRQGVLYLTLPQSLLLYVLYGYEPGDVRHELEKI
jgi:hypothetical protein